ncbi:MAG: tetratricopeptide repeat protein [Nocardiopsaceae bacterium]|nr:tetratricopeptide repeat protein [Nocardiopsaceae bacterium]
MNRRALVRASRLAEDLWPVRPPRNPVNQLHVLIHRLRQSLGDHDANVLQSRSAGYVLMVSDEQTDIGRFESLVLQAGAALRNGQPQEAERLCAEGMSLWRGELFADTDLPVSLSGAAARLSEERVELQETSIDAQMVLGRHKELIPSIAEATARHPLREHLWAQLMLAYYRSGRQADALEVYRKVYKLLDEELGAGPGQELQALHKGILSNDSSLLGSTQASVQPETLMPENQGSLPSSPRTRPRQLPAAGRHFTGRAPELQRLSEIADSCTEGGDPPIAVLTGPGGIGKTSLAVHWAHRSADRFPDGQLYVDLRGFGSGKQRRASDTVSYLLTALGVGIDQQPSSLDAKTALYRTLIAGSRMLLLLDNARDAAQVRPLLPGAGPCLVIVTSRSPLTTLAAVEGADILRLDVLSDGQARDLIRLYIGADRVAAETDAATDVARRCAYLPLALTVAASRAAVLPGMSLSSLAEELQDAQTLPDTLNAGERADVWAVLSWSYHAASPAAQRMFRLLSIHPGPDLTTEAAAHLTGTTVPETRRLLHELTMTSLISEKTRRRYSFHDLLRAYSRDLGIAEDPAAQRDTALGRLLDYYVCLAYRAAVTIEPDREHEIDPPSVATEQAAALTDHPKALTWFTEEYRALLGLVDAAYAAGHYVRACQLSWAMTEYCRRSGVWDDWLHVVRVAIDASSSLGDVRAIAHAQRSLGRAYCWRGMLDEGQRNMREALSMFETAGDDAGQGHVYRNLAYLYERRCDDAEALHHAELAVHHYRAADHPAGIARCLNTLAWYLARNGQCDQAIENGSDALRMLQEIGHQSGEAATWVTLGYAHHRLGEFQQAAECFEDALRILREIGDHDSEADTLVHLAGTLEAAGNQQQAQRAWQQAREILTMLNHPDANAILRGLRPRSDAEATPL